jgi:predicted nucleotidyltransferase
MTNQSAAQTVTPAQWLDAAVLRLRSAFDPSLVLLFGSRARGTATRRSDLDLLLVCETPAGPLERIERVLRLLQDSPWPVEPVVLTPGELQSMSHRPFIRRILAEGRILYER